MFHFESWVFFFGGGGGLNETQVDSQGLPPPFLHTASIKNWRCRSSGKKQLGEAEYSDTTWSVQCMKALRH